MKKVFSTDSPLDVNHAKNLLEQSDIACAIRNAGLMSGLGDIPFVEAWPELWVLDDQDESRAKALIETAFRNRPDGSAWRCAHCGEQNEAQFTACWQCARDHDG